MPKGGQGPPRPRPGPRSPSPRRAKTPAGYPKHGWAQNPPAQAFRRGFQLLHGKAGIRRGGPWWEPRPAAVPLRWGARGQERPQAVPRTRSRVASGRPAGLARGLLCLPPRQGTNALL